MSTPYEEIGAELTGTTEALLANDHEIGSAAMSVLTGQVQVFTTLIMRLVREQLAKRDARIALLEQRLADLETNGLRIVHIHAPHTHGATTIPLTHAVPVRGQRWWLFAIGGVVGFGVGILLNLLVNASTVDTTTAGTLTHFWATAVDDWWFKIVTTGVLTAIGAAALGSIRVIVGYDDVLDNVHVDVHENGGMA